MAASVGQSVLVSIRSSRPTTACSRLATARFIKVGAPAKVMYNKVSFADSQAADAEALGGSSLIICNPKSNPDEVSENQKEIGNIRGDRIYPDNNFRTPSGYSG